ncbi:hypothetical protein KKG48_02440 [Patescibacteria group bacterium]|nr:hypothetical protein [Patescibacteria group bacterium]MCG2694547.1 hypothetical protein [Candidatus Parcubacteria bacterium]
MFGNKENLHHAYLIEGNREKVFSLVSDYLENELQFSLKNNPDFWQGDFDTFGIDDGRKINDLQNKKSFSEKNIDFAGSGKQIFIIKTNFITREAQNSLLKMFEEPTADTHFFLIMNSGEVLLPTLKSRLMTIKKWAPDTHQNQNKDAEEFLKMTVGERIKFVQKFVGDTKKKIPADKIGAIELLNQLEKFLREKLDIKKMTKKEVFVFDEIIKCRNYLNDRSPSVKNLLEHMALIISTK